MLNIIRSSVVVSVLTVASSTVHAETIFFSYSDFGGGVASTINGTGANTQLKNSSDITGNMTVTGINTPTAGGPFNCTVADCATLTFTTPGGATIYNAGTETYTFTGGETSAFTSGVTAANFSLTPDGSGGFLGNGGQTSWISAQITNVGTNLWELTGELAHNSNSASINDLQQKFGIAGGTVLPYVYVDVVFTATQGGTGTVPSLTGSKIDSALVEVSDQTPEPGTFLMLGLGAVGLMAARLLKGALPARG